MKKFSYSASKAIKFWFLGWLWRHRSMEFTFPQMMKRFGKVLLILPRNESDVKVVRRWRERILFSIGNKDIVAFSIGAPLEIAQEWSNRQLFFTDGDISPFGIVSKKIIDAVKEEKCDFALDLSPDLDFITAQVPLRAQIPARLGIVRHDKNRIGEKFFNIMMQTSGELNYENIVKIISAGG